MYIHRSFDYKGLEDTLSKHPELVSNFSTHEWIKDYNNLCFTDGKGSYGLLEYNSDGYYTGHYFFIVRGRQALELARTILEEVFLTYGVKVVRGLTPVGNLGAKWMNKQLGFTYLGNVEVPQGECGIYYLASPLLNINARETIQ
jgi:hypothetical protein